MRKMWMKFSIRIRIIRICAYSAYSFCLLGLLSFCLFVFLSFCLFVFCLFVLTSCWSIVWRVSSVKSHSLCQNSKVALTQRPRSGIELPGQLKALKNLRIKFELKKIVVNTLWKSWQIGYKKLTKKDNRHWLFSQESLAIWPKYPGYIAS